MAFQKYFLNVSICINHDECYVHNISIMLSAEDIFQMLSAADTSFSIFSILSIMLSTEDNTPSKNVILFP